MEKSNSPSSTSSQPSPNSNDSLVKWKGEEGRSVLHIAIIRNRPNIVETLLLRGAHPDGNPITGDRFGKRPLHYACEFEWAFEAVVPPPDKEKNDKEINDNNILDDLIDEKIEEIEQPPDWSGEKTEITKKDLNKLSKEQILKFDKDGDGDVTQEEILSALDADGDGQITKAELVKYIASSRFTEEQRKILDSNNDGTISSKEVQAYIKSQTDIANDINNNDKELKKKIRAEIKDLKFKMLQIENDEMFENMAKVQSMRVVNKDENKKKENKKIENAEIEDIYCPITDIATLLLKFMANINVKDKNGITPLMSCAINANAQTAHVLLLRTKINLKAYTSQEAILRKKKNLYLDGEVIDNKGRTAMQVVFFFFFFFFNSSSRIIVFFFCSVCCNERKPC